jgi:hypothetical protein
MEDLEGATSSLLDRATERAFSMSTEESLERVPKRSEQSQWYGHATLHQLSCLWLEIQKERQAVRDVYMLAFSSILRSACSQENHWGWICDNVKPKSFVEKPVFSLFKGKMDQVASGAAAVRKDLVARKIQGVPSAVVMEDSAQDALASLEPNSVDLVVTSPPYFGMTDYIRSQRLTLYWLDLDVDALKGRETGARFKRHRKDVLGQYLGEMTTIADEMYRVLRPNHHACVVAGESPARTPYLERFLELVSESGFTVVERLTRSVPRQRALNASMTEESIIILQKG